MTQKYLGEILGFLGKTSDVRMAQYESEARVPKAELVKEMAGIFDVSPYALNVPDIDTYFGLMHTFFALEDMYGLKISEIDGEICLHLDKTNSNYTSLFRMFHSWQQEAAKLENGEISKEQYDEWRYKYPELDNSPHLPKSFRRGLVICSWKNLLRLIKKKRKSLREKRKSEHKKPYRLSLFENQ